MQQLLRMTDVADPGPYCWKLASKTIMVISQLPVVDFCIICCIFAILCYCFCN